MCWDPKSNIVSLKKMLSLITASYPLSFNLPSFLFYVEPFGISKKKDHILGKIKKEDRGWSYAKLAADVFWKWLPTPSPLWCATGEKQSQDIPFPSPRYEPHATRCCHPVWHIVNPLSILWCFLGIHMLFSSLTLQATKRCHHTLNSTRLFSSCSIFLDSCLHGTVL